MRQESPVFLHCSLSTLAVGLVLRPLTQPRCLAIGSVGEGKRGETLTICSRCKTRKIFLCVWMENSSFHFLLIFALEMAAKFPEAGIMITLSLISSTDISPLKKTKGLNSSIPVCFTNIQIYSSFSHFHFPIRLNAHMIKYRKCTDFKCTAQ